ncbi:hypothetical protein REPUB_Repub10bG0183000 [Reevesia pubescens]
MEATSLISSSFFTASSLPSALISPQNHDHKGLFSLTVNPQRCRISVVRKNLRFCKKAALIGNVEATGVPLPTSVPVRVAHELHQAGHQYWDVRTPEEFSAGHAPGAINIPYFYKLDLGCQLGTRSLMAATDLLAAGFTAVTDIAGGYAAWTQNGLPTE